MDGWREGGRDGGNLEESDFLLIKIVNFSDFLLFRNAKTFMR